MSIYKTNSGLPTTTKINLVNDMVLEVDGKVAQGKFDKAELDQIFLETGIAREFLREQLLGHTVATYTNWTHYKAETGYSIWQITPATYSYNALNQLYMDDKVLTNMGEATALTAIFASVFVYDSGTSAYIDNTVEAGTEDGVSFNLMTTTSDYLYLGSASVFNGFSTWFNAKGNNYTLVAEYWNGSTWVALTITDNTSNFIRDGAVSWAIPADWATATINAVPNYWVRISTTTTPVTIATALYLVPTTSVVGLLAMSSEQLTNEEWLWCTYNSIIYVTIRNAGATAYEGDYFITSASTATNKRNFFVSNHEFKADYQDSTYWGSNVALESGITAGDLIYISDNYTFNLATANVWRFRCMGVLLTTGYARMTEGIAQGVNTVGAGNIVAGDVLYLSQTPGKVSRTAPAPGGGRIQQRVGIALAAESGSKVNMLFRPEYV